MKTFPDDGTVHIQAPKCLLILTQAEYARAQQRGKAWRRRQRMERHRQQQQAEIEARRVEWIDRR